MSMLKTLMMLLTIMHCWSILVSLVISLLQRLCLTRKEEAKGLALYAIALLRKLPKLLIVCVVIQYFIVGLFLPSLCF